MKTYKLFNMKAIIRLASVVCLLTVGFGNAWGQATLPVSIASFSVGKNSLPTGVTGNGLGSDYSDGTYKLRMDGSEDYVQLYTDGAVGRLIFSVKMIGGSNSSWFQIMGSSDNSTYNNIGQAFPISGDQNDVVNCTTTVAIDPTYRYFRFILKYKGSNVGFGKLYATKATTSKYTVTFNAQGGTCATSSLTENNAAEGVVLPSASPTSSCTSEGWKFYGWATSAVSSLTTTVPTIVGKAGDRYYPTSTTTLHAVYATGEYTKITTIGEGGLTTGGKYLIVGAASGHNYIMKSNLQEFQWAGSDVGMLSAPIDDTDGKYHAADVNGQWCYTITGSTGEWWIQDVVNATDNYYDIAYLIPWGKMMEICI